VLHCALAASRQPCEHGLHSTLKKVTPRPSPKTPQTRRIKSGSFQLSLKGNYSCRRFTLAYCHIAHDCTVGDDVIFSNNGTLAGHVTVEDHVILGGLTAAHQFCRLGRHAMTGGCSKIVQDVPPFLLADGNPARIRGIDKVGMERHGFVTQSARGIIK
jgi:acyl-ACP--UDP-N-acetylglucosamine O-acyltransferase